MMLEQIQLARLGSQKIEHRVEPFFEGAARPALIRRPSLGLEKVKIQILNLDICHSKAPDEEIKEFMINTGEVVVKEEPLFAFCNKIHSCGHACKGVAAERKCLPCIDPSCSEASSLFNGINANELCTICYTSELGDEPCSKLGCGHVYHTRCVVELLQNKWPSLRISFGFMSCPKCKESIEIQGLSRPIAKVLGPLNSTK